MITQLLRNRFLISTLLISGFASCNSIDDNTRQQAEITGQAQADRTIDATNRDLDAKSTAMEADLATRQRFFQGVSGTFEGVIAKTESIPENLNIRFILSASVPVYRSSRVRALEEVIADLNGLHLNVEVVQWDDVGATGCNFTGIQPDLNSGNIRLIASDCPNSYSLWLTPPQSDVGTASVSSSSSAIANGLLTANESEASSMSVELDLTHGGSILKSTVNRVGR
jgi:hypothetical protein